LEQQQTAELEAAAVGLTEVAQDAEHGDGALVAIFDPE